MVPAWCLWNVLGYKTPPWARWSRSSFPGRLPPAFTSSLALWAIAAGQRIRGNGPQRCRSFQIYKNYTKRNTVFTSLPDPVPILNFLWAVCEKCIHGWSVRQDSCVFCFVGCGYRLNKKARQRSALWQGEGPIPESKDSAAIPSASLPSTEDVIRKTEQITKNIQELLRAAQENKHDR